MLSAQQEKLIRSLHSKKGREKSGLCLVEGEKNIKTARNAVSFCFTRDDTKKFDTLVTTETPQGIAAVARIPTWNASDVENKRAIVALDGVQDPGNIGTIFRLCLGFGATLILIDSADPTNPKVVRSSAGAIFHVPWIRVHRASAVERITKLKRAVYRLENRPKSVPYSHDMKFPENTLLIAGSEGRGISLNIPGNSIRIPHDSKLESLNVAVTVAIILNRLYSH